MFYCEDGRYDDPVLPDSDFEDFESPFSEIGFDEEESHPASSSSDFSVSGFVPPIEFDDRDLLSLEDPLPEPEDLADMARLGLMPTSLSSTPYFPPALPTLPPPLPPPLPGSEGEEHPFSVAALPPPPTPLHERPLFPQGVVPTPPQPMKQSRLATTTTVPPSLPPPPPPPMALLHPSPLLSRLPPSSTASTPHLTEAPPLYGDYGQTPSPVGPVARSPYSCFLTRPSSNGRNLLTIKLATKYQGFDLWEYYPVVVFRKDRMDRFRATFRYPAVLPSITRIRFQLFRCAMVKQALDRSDAQTPLAYAGFTENQFSIVERSSPSSVDVGVNFNVTSLFGSFKKENSAMYRIEISCGNEAQIFHTASFCIRNYLNFGVSVHNVSNIETKDFPTGQLLFLPSSRRRLGLFGGGDGGEGEDDEGDDTSQDSDDDQTPDSGSSSASLLVQTSDDDAERAGNSQYERGHSYVVGDDSLRAGCDQYGTLEEFKSRLTEGIEQFRSRIRLALARLEPLDEEARQSIEAFRSSIIVKTRKLNSLIEERTQNMIAQRTRLQENIAKLKSDISDLEKVISTKETEAIMNGLLDTSLSVIGGLLFLPLAFAGGSAAAIRAAVKIKEISDLKDGKNLLEEQIANHQRELRTLQRRFQQGGTRVEKKKRKISELDASLKNARKERGVLLCAKSLFEDQSAVLSSLLERLQQDRNREEVRSTQIGILEKEFSEASELAGTAFGIGVESLQERARKMSRAAFRLRLVVDTVVGDVEQEA